MLYGIIAIILGLLGLISLGYYYYAGDYAGFGSSFLWFWLFAGICFIALGILFYLQKKHGILSAIPKKIRVIIIVLFSIGVIVFITMEGLIISKINSKCDKKVDYVIILGAQVRGEVITKSLAKRLDVAYDYLKESENSKVICTGGQGKGEDISEAYAMKKYLIQKGIKEDRIILEDQSTSTYENLKFSLDIIKDKDASIAIATNNFHVYRAIHLAKYIGFKDVHGLAGDSDHKLFINYMVREGIALFKEIIVH